MVQFINLGESAQGRLGRDLGLAIGQGAGKAGQRIMDQQRQQQQSGILSRVLSGQGDQQELSQLDPQYQMKLAELQNKQMQMQQASELQQMKMQEQQQKEIMNIQQKVAPLQGAFGTIQRMRDIGANGRLGRGSSVLGFFGGETAKDKNEYEQLGKSLISLSTNIPIRNRLEFETLAEKLYDSSLPDKAREGVMDAMERIIQNSMSQYLGPLQAQQQGQVDQQPQQQQPQQDIQNLLRNAPKDRVIKSPDGQKYKWDNGSWVQI